MFWLANAKKNKKGLCPIYIRITISGKRTEISTNIFVNPANWDSHKKKIKGSEELVQLQNKRLTQFEAEINRIHLTLEQHSQTVSGEKIKSLLFQKPALTFLEVYQKMIEEKEMLIGIEYTARTLEIYQTNLNHCKDFLRKTKQEQIAVADTKTKFIKEYEHYLKTVVKASHNYAVRILRNIKQVVQYAIAHEYVESSPLLAVQFKTKESKKNRVYLTHEEMNLITNHTFVNPTLQKIADLFIFQCLTGFSYADIATFKFDADTTKHNNRVFIEKQRQKKQEGTPQMLPIVTQAMQILEKYQMKLPIISNQTYNRIIKEIAAVVGITKNLTTHVARRTAAMYWLNDKDISFEIVAQMLGHESDRTTRKYYAHILIAKIDENLKHLI